MKSCVLSVIMGFVLCMQPACAVSSQQAAQAVAPVASSGLPVLWQPLAARLAADGLYGADVEAALLQIGNVPSEDPMGRKITELYKRKFVAPPPKDPNAPKAPPQTVYKDSVTPENIEKCREFLKQNAAAFAKAQRIYGVPKEVAVALLFVETRLGAYIGKVPAFLTLASMSASRSPEIIPTFLAKLPDTQAHTDWISGTMQKRSDWAYKELAAFIRFVRAAKIDPMSVAGSMYGAIGLCQYMPSNLEPLGADGNNDGVVNLFEPEDAIASLSNYLHKHGWKPGLTRNKRIVVLKKYNNSFAYANTILTLAEAIDRAEGAAVPAKAAKQPAQKAKNG